ncbi:hypothetical protein [Chroococcus sp. FPU101]|nr:hypothetical protein [Chroococcus sp. FPU101]
MSLPALPYKLEAVAPEVLILSLPVPPRKSIYSTSLIEPPPEVVPPVGVV